MYFILLVWCFSLCAMQVQKKDILDRIGQLTLVTEDQVAFKIPSEELIRINYFSVIKSMIEDWNEHKNDQELESVKMEINCDSDLLNNLWTIMAFLARDSDENKIKLKKFFLSLNLEQKINVLNAAEAYENEKIKLSCLQLFVNELVKISSAKGQKEMCYGLHFPLIKGLEELKKQERVDLWKIDGEQICKIAIHPKLSLVAHVYTHSLGISKCFKKKYIHSFEKHIKKVSWHPSKKRLAILDVKGDVYLWHLKKKSLPRVFSHYNYTARELGIKFYDNKRLIFFYRDAMGRPVRTISQQSGTVCEQDFISGRIFVSNTMKYFAGSHKGYLIVVNPKLAWMAQVPIRGKILTTVSWAPHKENVFVYGLIPLGTFI